MTLTAYLSLLSLGSSIENRTSPDSPETEPEEIQRLHRIANAVSRAQVDVITSVSRYGAPIEERGCFIRKTNYCPFSTVNVKTDGKPLFLS